MKRLRGLFLVVVIFVVIAAVGFFTWSPHLVGERAPAPANGAREEAAGHWTCAMHPQVQKAEPGRCPLCGMDLYFKERVATDAVAVSEEMRELIGIATVAAETTLVGAEVRTVGRIEIDERRIHRAHARVQGWIKDLAVDFVGAPVRRGQELLAIHSPELLATAEEYLIARDAAERLGPARDADARRLGEGLLEAARRRLELFNVPPAEIERLGRERRVERTITLRAPAGGHVTAIMARRGMEVTPGMALFEIADLSAVWLTADVYEDEMAGIAVGMEATASLRQLPGRVFKGRIDFIYPTLDLEARANRVRMTLPNPGLELRPGMYGDISLAGPRRAALTIPLDAVVRTGVRDLVYVEIETGVFRRREVTLGAQRGDRYIVFAGLVAGERVAIGGVFFLDSEASLRAAALGGQPPAAPAPGTPATPECHAPGQKPPAAVAPAGHRH